MDAVPPIDGVLVVDKPSGPTSHKVVAKVRRLLRTKTGHLGTLDPAATGVLPLVLGRATRLARFMKSDDKEYLARVRLGSVTDTYDGDGQVISERPIPEIAPNAAKRLLDRFVGEVTQVPPMFSAVKVSGERLYKAARRGEVRERPSRKVSIFRLELLDQHPGFWDLEVHCSSGTYIRTLAYDIGEQLGCGAHLEMLRRTRSGAYDLAHAIQLDEIETSWKRTFIPIHELLTDLPTVAVEGSRVELIRHGNPIAASVDLIEGEYCRLTHGNLLLAIGEIEGSFILPRVVLQAR